jgi:cytochrome c oxidase subunit II
MTRSRSFLLTFAALLLGTLVLAPVAAADLLTPEDGGSPNADSIDSLYKFVLAIAAIVFVGVEGVLLYCIVKFKARKGAVAAQIRGNTRLEIGWTAGAALILVVLAAVTFIKLDEIRNPPDSDPNGVQLASGVEYASVKKRLPPSGKSLNICVNGQQYVWRFTYSQNCDDAPLDAPFAYEEMVVPTGTTVTLEIKAQDVAHSWWIPALGGKFDAVPGYTNQTWFKVPADREGIYTGQCAELCGRNHANMVARVRAISPQEYENWIAERRTDIRNANQAAEVQRKELENEQAGRPAGDASAGDNPAGGDDNETPAGAPASGTDGTDGPQPGDATP